MKKVGLVFIGTGKYADFFPRWKQCVDDNFLSDCEKTIFAFTDVEKDFFKAPDVLPVKVDNCIWPQATLFRYKWLNYVINAGATDNLDYIFYIDSDLFPQSKITLEDITCEGKPLTGVHHPGNFMDPNWETFETNPECAAFVSKPIDQYGENAVYHQGCFWGGEQSAIKKMASTLDQRIDSDLGKGIMACWYDESHMNRYFLENLSLVNTVSWNYAFPENGPWKDLYSDVEVKMLHADKSDKEYPRPPSSAYKLESK